MLFRSTIAMKTLITLFVFALCSTFVMQAQVYKYDFTTKRTVKEGFVKVTPSDIYSDNKGYGYDLGHAFNGKTNAPFFFSLSVPDGNYRITALIGSKTQSGVTTIRGESRRLFYENLTTRKGDIDTCQFVINKRNAHIAPLEVAVIRAKFYLV